jgi:hypothetical protein
VGREREDPQRLRGHSTEGCPLKPRFTTETRTVEWFTPPHIIEAARHAMGGIDTDGASSAIANQIVKADVFYTKENSGLDHDWYGNVWLNPPYAGGIVGQFTAHLAAQVRRVNVHQACVLTNNCCDTGWFHDLSSVVTAYCLLKGRVRFLGVDLRPVKTPLQGQIIHYIGGDVDRFHDAFAPLGLTVTVARRDGTGGEPVDRYGATDKFRWSDDDDRVVKPDPFPVFGQLLDEPSHDWAVKKIGSTPRGGREKSLGTCLSCVTRWHAPSTYGNVEIRKKFCGRCEAPVDRRGITVEVFCEGARILAPNRASTKSPSPDNPPADNRPAATGGRHHSSEVRTVVERAESSLEARQRLSRRQSGTGV